MNNKTSQDAAFDSSHENDESSQKQQSQLQSLGEELMEHPIVISNIDVLSGRTTEKTHRHHGGNVVLRSLITESLPAYRSCQTIHDRAIVINGIIDKMHNSSGVRFLRMNQVHGHWMVMKSHQIRNKVATLVRDAFRRSKQKHSTRLLSGVARANRSLLEKNENQMIQSISNSDMVHQQEQQQNYQPNPLSWSSNLDDNDRTNQFRLIPYHRTKISVNDQNQLSLENVGCNFCESMEMSTPQRQYFSQHSIDRTEEGQHYHHRNSLIADSVTNNQLVKALNDEDDICVYGQNLQSTTLRHDHSTTSYSFLNVNGSFENHTTSNSNDDDHPHGHDDYDADDETNFEDDEFDQLIENTLGPISAEDFLLNHDYWQSMEHL